mmetsp:Transcript_8860/g.15237  ORF Transcript_8860/g.15237 Transcript_8860/m.15237 type:complete len:149 (+) Transcript_8860:90-536(+)
MQKILLAFFLVACAGAERDADAVNSLATLLLSRNPTGAFNPSTPPARFSMHKPTIASSRPVAMKKPTVASSRPVTMKADDQKMALTPAFRQAAAALAAMTPLMALADGELLDGVIFVLKIFAPFLGFVVVVNGAEQIGNILNGGGEEA